MPALPAHPLTRRRSAQSPCFPRAFVERTLVLAIASSSLAGYAASEPSSAAPADRHSSMEEVRVYSKYTTNDRLDTATGLGLTLQETPQSVSVITHERIVDQNLRSLTEVVKNAPGISAKGRDSSRHAFAARGFTIDNYQLDGVPIYWSSGGDAGETQTDTALYERIEVVRGATGLLTGAGNPSASINLVRKHADSTALGGTLSVLAGRWDTYGMTADVGTALNSSGSVRGRMVMRYEDGDSFRDLAGDTKRVLYGVVDADLTDATLLRVGASYQDNDPTASTWGGLTPWYSDGTRTDWDRSKTVGADWTSWASTVENQFLDVVHHFSNGWEAKFNVNRIVNEADLKLLYLSGTVDRTTGEGLGASPYNSDTEREQISYSIQLSGDYSLFGRTHDLTLGAISSKQDQVAYVVARSNIAPVGNFFQWDGNYPQPTWGARSSAVDTTTEQVGIYAATRFSITDRFKLILGGRVADWEQTGTSYGAAVDFGENGVFIPYAGALYDITDNHTVYASYTEIFQPQNHQDRTGGFLGPIVGKSHELGLKSRFFDDTLHTTLAAFQVLQDDLAQPDDGQLVPGTIFQAYRAAEGAESKGVELEVVGQLMPGWDLSFSYTHFEAEDADGLDFNTEQPRELLKLYTTYRFGGALDKLTIAGGVTWEGGYYKRATNPVSGAAEKLEQESFSLVSLMARYDVTPNLSAQVNVDNVLDETYYNQIGFYDQLEFGEPRNITATLQYTF